MYAYKEAYQKSCIIELIYSRMYIQKRLYFI